MSDQGHQASWPNQYAAERLDVSGGHAVLDLPEFIRLAVGSSSFGDRIIEKRSSSFTRIPPRDHRMRQQEVHRHAKVEGGTPVSSWVCVKHLHFLPAFLEACIECCCLYFTGMRVETYASTGVGRSRCGSDPDCGP
jgi:hypothetical protein